MSERPRCACAGDDGQQSCTACLSRTPRLSRGLSRGEEDGSASRHRRILCCSAAASTRSPSSLGSVRHLEERFGDGVVILVAYAKPVCCQNPHGDGAFTNTFCNFPVPLSSCVALLFFLPLTTAPLSALLFFFFSFPAFLCALVRFVSFYFSRVLLILPGGHSLVVCAVAFRAKRHHEQQL